MLCLNKNASAEGTKQLEPSTAPLKSVCKIVLSRNANEYRIPFALLNCKEDFRLNVHISDFNNEKIYLGFGEIINYQSDAIKYTDVKYQVKTPKGDLVTGFSLRPLPNVTGSAGFISSRDQVDAGPDFDKTNPGGYNPLVINPTMNGDYIIEFEIPVSTPGSSQVSEMRVFKYFDVTVAKGNTIIPGRLWSKAWQLCTRTTDANIHASFSVFYIYTSDSIVTSFDCNGLAGGVWSIYSNEWGSSTSGAWEDRRQSLRGNATVQPQYKIFLNDPDSTVYPTGHIGEMVGFSQISGECDTVLTFAATVSKGGIIDFLVDVPPLNPNSTGPEDVKLTYNVAAGYNVLLPSWNGKDGNGVPIANGTEVSSYISFLNGLSNVPLYDVEDNPRGFKVDIVRPKKSSGSTMLKLFWDDTKLPARYFPGGNVIDGCVYSGIEPYSGCHNWSRFLPFGDTSYISLGDTNTVNSWWYLTTNQMLEMSVKLKNRPSSGHVSGPVTICKGQMTGFNTLSIPFAQEYVWNISGQGFSTEVIVNAPDTVFSYFFNESMTSGEYIVSVFGRNAVCGDGVTAEHKININNRPVANFVNENPCQGTGITFTDQSNNSAADLSEYTWITNSIWGEERSFHGNPAVIVFDSVADYNVTLVFSDVLGCADTIKKNVTIKPKPDADFEIIASSGINKAELHFDNRTTGASEYSWNFGNNVSSSLEEPVIVYDREGDYTIKLVAINLGGCKDTAIRTYSYMPGLWIPNAFSPDNNGENDIFRPVTERTTLEPYQFLVYNKWGQLIFKSTNPDLGWDGKYNGEPCPAGSYSYLLQYREPKSDNSETITLRGMVSLIR